MPIVVVSVASESGELVLAALDAGAVDFVQKPTALATDKVLEIADESDREGQGGRGGEAGGDPRHSRRGGARRRRTAAQLDIVVIGISTGGPQALKM